MIRGSEVISEVRALVVDSVIEGRNIQSEKVEELRITDDTPLLCLYFADLGEDSLHCNSVLSVLKLIKVDIIKDPKEVKKWR